MWNTSRRCQVIRSLQCGRMYVSALVAECEWLQMEVGCSYIDSESDDG